MNAEAIRKLYPNAVDVYIVCPVRKTTPKMQTELVDYVKNLEDAGFFVYWPYRDAPQDDETGYNIMKDELAAINRADIVGVYWDEESFGSHFDLGAAMALDKDIFVIKIVHEDDPEKKSYTKVLTRYVAEKFMKQKGWECL